LNKKSIFHVEGLQWVSLIAFALKQSQVWSGLALKQGFVFLMLWILLFSPLCCSLMRAGLQSKAQLEAKDKA